MITCPAERGVFFPESGHRIPYLIRPDRIGQKRPQPLHSTGQGNGVVGEEPPPQAVDSVRDALPQWESGFVGVFTTDRYTSSQASAKTRVTRKSFCPNIYI